jgi:sugar lactone lactonase YvrE
VKWKLEGQEYSRWKLVEWAGPGQLLIATEFPRKRVAIVDSETGEAVTEHHGLACSEGAMVSPDGRWLLNRYNTKKATSCIDLRSGVAFKGAPLTREFQAFAFSRTSGVLAGATEDGRVVLWSPELTEQLAAFESGLGAPGVCFSGDGRWLVLCDSENGTLATWETVALLSGALKPAATKAKPKPRPKATLKSRS